MDILYWIVIGIVAGALAKYVIPGEGPGGIIGDLIVGIVGAFLGGFLFRSLGIAAAGGVLWSIIVAFIGAVVLLFVMRLFTSRRTVS